MPDIRGFFAPKKRPAPTPGPNPSPSPTAGSGPSGEPDPKRRALAPLFSPPAAAQAPASQDTPAPASEAPQPGASGPTPEQLKRMERNRIAALARRRGAEDPFGLVETLACVDDAWRTSLGAELDKGYFKRLVKFVRGEYEGERGDEVYPPAHEVLNALRLCPLREVKVVVLGQDPYHGPGQAHGLAFSVNAGVPIPPSLRNMYKELKADLGVEPPRHGCLKGWARQGVLLLNTSLTVRRGAPQSHANKGWEHFTDAVIRRVNSEGEGVVFVLWGKPAQKKQGLISSRKHHVMKSSHPSPLSASRPTKACGAFLGSSFYSKVNELLRGMGKEEIDWANLNET
mmetsp:Transcript_44088/g.138538  ORF Transcript_44088/g.138538 Transcript_44088/m.138538 type:complete len:342 (-) Transcript_44088:69-1094(-)